MNHFFCRLNPPRRTFAEDMSDVEAKLMMRHAEYWRTLVARGDAVLFGLVADPRGAWGVGIVGVADRAEATALTSVDPVILADCGFSFDVFPMPRGAMTR
jgi:uncharacterized protein